MARKSMERKVRFTRAHTVIQPASVLEVNGVPVPGTERPETRTEYAAGQELTLGSTRFARDFCRAMGGAAELI